MSEDTGVVNRDFENLEEQNAHREETEDALQQDNVQEDEEVVDNSASGAGSGSTAGGNRKEDEFYLRYYVGHRGRFGHEFLEFEIQPNGLLRYANDTRYRNDGLIRKEVMLNPAVIREFKKMVDLSEIVQEDDSDWPMPSDDGSQELEIVSNGEHISFVVSKPNKLLKQLRMNGVAFASYVYE